MKKNIIQIMFFFVITVFIAGCENGKVIDQKFTFAVIPDTQNYIDFTYQKNEGFPIDAAELFIQQMEFLAANTEARGGEIAFITSVGDVWQNNEIGVDEEHYDRGMREVPEKQEIPTEKLLAGIHDFELPLARRGYDLIEETGVVFSVAPGNHDYEYWWTIDPFPNEPEKTDKLIENKLLEDWHIGGYETFNGVFGPKSKYFNDKNWYISSLNGGVNSAQLFEAGGYNFLHFAFEMQAGDDVLKWAQGIIDENSGIPTMMSTHDFLNPRGERLPSRTADLAEYDPEHHNSAEDIWNDWISKNDQIFMVLSGHQIGQSLRIDNNDKGSDVFQLLSDYQARQQVVKQASEDERGSATGDGWLRLMNFDFSNEIPTIDIRTFSTYYKKYSNEMPEYVSWYRDLEQPNMTDQEFKDADHFTIELNDFKKRFGEPQLN